MKNRAKVKKTPYKVFYFSMGYFKNKDINLLNIHFCLFLIGFDVGFIFGPIYLYKLGIPIPFIFGLMGASYLTRIFFRILMRPLAFHFGLKPFVIIGLWGIALSYFFLMQARNLDLFYWIYFFIYSFSSSIYWLHYHVLYAKMGDHEHRGKQVSLQMLLSTLSGILGPLINGFLILKFGFSSSFYLAAFFLLLSSLFVMKVSQNPLPEKVQLKSISKNLNWNGFWMFFFGGISNPVHTTIWQLILFLLLKNTLSLGSLLTYSILLQTLSQLITGRLIDKGRGKLSCDLGFGGVFLNTLCKALWGTSVPVIVGLEVSESLTKTLRSHTETVFFYNEGKKSHHPFYYQYLAEMGWDLGAGGALLVYGLLAFLGTDLRILMILGSFGILLAWHNVRPYYKASHTSPSQCI